MNGEHTTGWRDFHRRKKGKILASPDPCPLPGHEWDPQRPVNKAWRTVGSARSVPPENPRLKKETAVRSIRLGPAGLPPNKKSNYPFDTIEVNLSMVCHPWEAHLNSNQSVKILKHEGSLNIIYIYIYIE